MTRLFRVAPWLPHAGATARLLSLAAIVAVLLTGCGSTASVAAVPIQRPQATATAPLTIVLGEDIWTAEVRAATGQSAISQERALETAHAHAPTWQQATAVSVRYVTLSVRAADGTVAESMHDKSVWLVTFTDATYDPPGACACAEYYQRPTTAVAVDAQNGAFLAAFGLRE